MFKKGSYSFTVLVAKQQPKQHIFSCQTKLAHMPPSLKEIIIPPYLFEVKNSLHLSLKLGKKPQFQKAVILCYTTIFTTVTI